MTILVTGGAGFIGANFVRDWPTPAARPAKGALDCSKFSTAFGLALPDWRHHLNRFAATQADDSNASRS